MTEILKLNVYTLIYNIKPISPSEIPILQGIRRTLKLHLTQIRTSRCRLKGVPESYIYLNLFPNHLLPQSTTFSCHFSGQQKSQ